MTGNGGYLSRPAPSGLADVIEIILGKGIVVDAYLRVSLIGIELLTVDARIVIASVDTYLRFAEATNRLDLLENGPKSLTDALGDAVEGVASNVVENKVRDGIAKVEQGAEKVGPVAEAVVAGAEKVVAKIVDVALPDDES